MSCHFFKNRWLSMFFKNDAPSLRKKGVVKYKLRHEISNIATSPLNQNYRYSQFQKPFQIALEEDID